MNLRKEISELTTFELEVENASSTTQYVPELRTYLRTGQTRKLVLKGSDPLRHLLWSSALMSGNLTVRLIPKDQEQGPPNPFLSPEPSVLATLIRLREVFREYGAGLEAKWVAVHEETEADAIDATRRLLNAEYRLGWRAHGNLLYTKLQKALYSACRGLAELYEGIMAALGSYEDLDGHQDNHPRTLAPLLHRTADVVYHEQMKIPQAENMGDQHFQIYLLRKAVFQIIMGLRTLQVLPNTVEEHFGPGSQVAAQVAFQFTEIRTGIYAIVFGLRTHFGIAGSSWDAID